MEHVSIGQSGSVQRRLALSAVAAFAALMLVVLVACGGSGSGSSAQGSDEKNVSAPDMTIVMETSPDFVADMLKDQIEVKAGDHNLFTNSEGFANDFLNGFDMYNAEAYKKYDGCYAFTVTGEAGELTLADIETGANPYMADFHQIIVGDELTAEDIANRVAEVVPFDRAVVYHGGGNDFNGCAMGNGCYTLIHVGEFGSVYELYLVVFSLTDSPRFSGVKVSEVEAMIDNMDTSSASDVYRK